MDGLAQAERNYDRAEPAEDLRTDAEIEQDVADRIGLEKQAARVKGYVYDANVWAKVTAAVASTELKDIGSSQGGDKEGPAYPRCAGDTTQLINAVRRVLADPATQILSGHRVALEQLTR